MLYQLSYGHQAHARFYQESFYSKTTQVGRSGRLLEPNGESPHAVRLTREADEPLPLRG